MPTHELTAATPCPIQQRAFLSWACPFVMFLDFEAWCFILGDRRLTCRRRYPLTSGTQRRRYEMMADMAESTVVDMYYAGSTVHGWSMEQGWRLEVVFGTIPYHTFLSA
jgi:hypothetical protein